MPPAALSAAVRPPMGRVRPPRPGAHPPSPLTRHTQYVRRRAVCCRGRCRLPLCFFVSVRLAVGCSGLAVWGGVRGCVCWRGQCPQCVSKRLRTDVCAAPGCVACQVGQPTGVAGVEGATVSGAQCVGSAVCRARSGVCMSALCVPVVSCVVAVSAHCCVLLQTPFGEGTPRQLVADSAGLCLG